MTDEKEEQSLTPMQLVKLHKLNQQVIAGCHIEIGKVVKEKNEEIKNLKKQYQKLLDKLNGVRAVRQRELAKCQEEKVELMKGYDEILKFYSDKHLKSMLDYQHFLLCDLDKIIKHLVGDSYDKEIHNKIEKLAQKRYKQFLGFTDECLEDSDERSSKELLKDICESLSCLSEEELKQFKVELDENDWMNREEDVLAYRRRERYLKQKVNEYKEALNKIKNLLESRLAADGSDYFEIDQDDDVLEVVYGLSKMGEK